MAATTVQEIFDRIVQVDPSAVQGVNGVMLFDLSGEDGGKWTVTLVDGQAPQLAEGETVSPNVTFSIASQDFIAIATGQMNPISAFMQGKVRVSGDMALAMRLQSILS